jgi:hypothetical protein
VKYLTFPPPASCWHLHPYQHGLGYAPPYQLSGWLSLLLNPNKLLNIPGIMVWSMMRCVEVWTESMEDIFSTYYKHILSTISHEFNFCGHTLISTFFSCFCMWNFQTKFVCTIQLCPVSNTKVSYLSFHFIKFDTHVHHM